MILLRACWTLGPALVAVMLAGCGSDSRGELGRVVVSASGKVGPLHVDKSDRADVVAFAGRPDSERRGWYGKPFYAPYDALGYRCGDRPATDKAGVPRCKTVFYVDPRNGKLELLYTEDARFVDPHGVHPGTGTSLAERQLHKRPSNGCFSGYRFDTDSGFLVMWLDGGRKLVGNHVGFLVVHSRRFNPGVLDCIDS
jgi:hypothetical protein